MDALQNRPLKFHFLPFLAPGHMAPLCEIARSFAALGQHVTIITTPSNAQPLQKSIDRDRASGHQIAIHTVDFPSKEVGLPDGVENLSAVTNAESTHKVFLAASVVLQKSFGDFIMQNPPDCIVADMVYSWTFDLATRLGIPRLVFNGFCLFSNYAILQSVKAISKADQDTDPFVIPGLPHQITMNPRPLVRFLQSMEKLLEVEAESYGILVNSFAELDGEFVDHYEKTTGHKAWHIGPTALLHQNFEEKAERNQQSVVMGEKNHHQRVQISSWLNSKQPNSVLYICFGSSSYFSDSQLFEIASGVESSGHNFIWVISELDKKRYQKWLPKGFEERLLKKEDKGMILSGWAPQVMILDHPAIGGFLTHCGWNSAVESISAGVPMITWPLHSDQFYNEKLITQVRELGVEVGAEEWCEWVYDERKKIVSKEKVGKAVRKLMDEEEGKEIRKRVRELGKKAKKAVEEGGSSHKNLTRLICDLQRFRDSKHTPGKNYNSK